MERRFPDEYGRQVLKLEGDADNPLTLLHAMPQAAFDTLLAARAKAAGYCPEVPASPSP